MNNIGCSGWYYQEWSNGFYQGLQKKNWFKHYFETFSTVELNSPFYHIPKIATAKAWYRNAPNDFIYSVKVNRSITHYKHFKNTQKLIREFYDLCDVLHEKLGCILFQLPPQFNYTVERLENIISSLDLRYKNVIEFRHASWWNDDVFKTFKKHKIIFCSVSMKNLPQEIIKTTNQLYLRFHGLSGYDYCYSKKELADYCEKIYNMKFKNIWVYFNNDIGGHAVHNALEFRKML